ncbi:methyltransferase domain protein [Ceratobasidium sp. AG-Ba]|nr:methyltransferase domain protein [Ceratobasidium sp. AG-Ba]
MGVFAYYDADTNGTVYHVIPSPTPRSALSDIHTETETSLSGLTILSDDLPGYFVIHDGRQYPASDHIAKWLPSDNIRRYTIQYMIRKHLLGGDCVEPVREILAPIPDRKRQALELGTRTGTWTQAISAEFPHVQFRSLDVIPMIPHIPRPNVIFEVYDFTEGLMLEDNSQDVVFMNYIMEMTKDYRALLCEVYRVLRPGGFISINDYNPHYWDSEDFTVPAQRTNPRGCHLVNLVREHISSLGIDPDTCDKLPQWLAPGSDVWSGGEKGFRDIQSFVVSFPGYPHDGCSCMDRVDASMVSCYRYMSVASAQDFLGILKESGMEGEETERLIDDAIEELRQHERCILLKGYYIYAAKI